MIDEERVEENVATDDDCNVEQAHAHLEIYLGNCTDLDRLEGGENREFLFLFRFALNGVIRGQECVDWYLRKEKKQGYDEKG
jgi:O-glycosyl hydrolase